LKDSANKLYLKDCDKEAFVYVIFFLACWLPMSLIL
jgi:hypothetical protein